MGRHAATGRLTDFGEVLTAESLRSALLLLHRYLADTDEEVMLCHDTSFQIWQVPRRHR